MKTIKVRTLLLVSLFLISSLSWLTYVIAHLIETKSLQIGIQAPSRIGVWLAVSIGVLSVTSLFGVGLHRWIIKPLEAMGKAARQIAEGDLEVAIPPSGVREIADVKSGFDIMLEGLHRTVRQQSALEEERQFFIGAIAHDLRTPLFSLKGYLEGLKHSIVSTPEKIEHYVNVCLQKSNQLDLLVADLMAYAKTEFMEDIYSEDQIEITGILQKSVETIRHAAESKWVTIHFEAPQKRSGQRTLAGDAYLLERAFNNLLDNAVRHTPGNGEIWVGCTFTPDRAAITIRDSGPGIPEAELPHVFEPLYRGDNSRNQASGGSGLGLTIAKRIFNAHGGDLTASNHLRGGAVLTGWIPAVAASD